MVYGLIKYVDQISGLRIGTGLVIKFKFGTITNFISTAISENGIAFVLKRLVKKCSQDKDQKRTCISCIF